MRATSLLTVMLSLAPAPALAAAGAQAAPAVPVGTRVRFTPPERMRGLVGTIAGQRHDTLLLRTERDDTVPVPLAELDRLELSRGVHGHALKGLGLGFLVGAVVGGVVGAAVEPDELLGRGVNVAAGIILGGAGGSLIGLGVGASVRTERWEAIPGDGAGAANGPRSAGGLTLGLSLRF
jgi:hypothetical protein